MSGLGNTSATVEAKSIADMPGCTRGVRWVRGSESRCAVCTCFLGVTVGGKVNPRSDTKQGRGPWPLSPCWVV